jgi:hypothetical protein
METPDWLDWAKTPDVLLGRSPFRSLRPEREPSMRPSPTGEGPKTCPSRPSRPNHPSVSHMIIDIRSNADAFPSSAVALHYLPNLLIRNRPQILAIILGI